MQRLSWPHLGSLESSAPAVGDEKSVLKVFETSLSFFLGGPFVAPKCLWGLHFGRSIHVIAFMFFPCTTEDDLCFTEQREPGGDGLFGLASSS